MLLSLLFILGGFALLVFGGDWLVRGAVALATKLKVTPAVIGLTIVAAGTSVPELAVSALASIRGSPDIAIGNVVGSNILNIALILGVASILRPIIIRGNTIRLEYPVMALTTMLCVVVARDGSIDRLEALFFLLSYCVFNAYLITLVRSQIGEQEKRGFAEEVKELTPVHGSRSAVWQIAIGVIALGIGAELSVHGAVAIAKSLGLSERIIGLTIVAIGTSLPELVTSVVAALKKQDEVAVGNIIGSNIFNILGILGISGLILPLRVSPSIVAYDNWWMLGVAAMLFPLMFSGRRITRGEGILLVAVYGVYLGQLLTSGG